MIIKKEKKDGITILYVRANIDAKALESQMGKQIKTSAIHNILKEDTDVYVLEKEDAVGKEEEDGEKGKEEEKGKGKLLLRFRKALISKDMCNDFYNAVIECARTKTSNRAAFQGVIGAREAKKNKYVMSNIFGFMDGWAPSQKKVFTKAGDAILKPDIRMTRFNMYSPDKYTKTLPFLHVVDSFYKRLVPDCYAKQYAKAAQIRGFTIDDTAFTTITLNLNHPSRLHTDKGDDDEGFGNLSVIEHGGKYTGGETCFPRYGLGADVRTGDILFMNVHEPHCNLPIQYSTNDAERLSIVCYLRKNIWIKGKVMTRKKRALHNATVKKRFLKKI